MCNEKNDKTRDQQIILLKIKGRTLEKRFENISHKNDSKQNKNKKKEFVVPIVFVMSRRVRGHV